MSTPTPWLIAAQDELRELELEQVKQALDPASAYRVLVLCARLEQARALGLNVEPPPGAPALAARCALVATRPEGRRLLSRWEEQLRGDEDPFGELLDVLLAVDDAATVDDAAGRIDDARELVRMADACASLAPERIGVLGELAENRLGTLPEHASIRVLWDTVAQAAAQAAVEGLPSALPAPTSLSRQRLLKTLRAQSNRIEEEISKAAPLQLIGRIAAASGRVPSDELFEGPAVDVYFEGEVLHIQVSIPPGRKPEGPVQLHLRTSARTRIWELPFSSVSTQAVIVRLGTLEEIRERLLREGLRWNETRPFVVLELKEEAE